MVVETKAFVPVLSYKKSRNKLRLSWAKLKLSYEEIVKTPTTTSIQLNTTSTAVGFDTIMTVHTHPTQTLSHLKRQSS